jgi:hypothetical protein
MKVELNNLSKMNRYKENLLVSDDQIFSYLTPVAKIDHINKTIIVDKYYSMTTSTHINFVGREYNYKVIKNYK